MHVLVIYNLILNYYLKVVVECPVPVLVRLKASGRSVWSMRPHIVFSSASVTDACPVLPPVQLLQTAAWCCRPGASHIAICSA